MTLVLYDVLNYLVISPDLVPNIAGGALSKSEINGRLHDPV
jgi:hypothetical protein